MTKLQGYEAALLIEFIEARWERFLQFVEDSGHENFEDVAAAIIENLED